LEGEKGRFMYMVLRIARKNEKPDREPRVTIFSMGVVRVTMMPAVRAVRTVSLWRGRAATV
jgi:hypothetical protein